MYTDQCAVIDNKVDWSSVKTVMEIGFNAGHSSDFFLSRSKDISVVSFELTPGKHTLVGKQYIDKTYPDRHEMVWGDSTLTVPKFETRKFDLIFIDGGHEVEVARADIANCMRFATSDTIVIMDDVIYEYTQAAKYSVGPTRAWCEFIRMSIIEETFHVDLADGRGMSIGMYKVFHDFSIPRPKVVDAFMFYNELEMLKYRLTVMGPYVDRFVICECPVSFAGKPKPLYFQENKHLFEPWLDKITHLVWKGYRSDVYKLEDSWYNENNQRNYLLEGLKDLKPNDIIIISDLDEIVDPNILENIDTVLGQIPIILLSMDLYYYDIEHICVSPWKASRAARYSFVRDIKPHFCRNSKRDDPTVEKAGWHLSYFGDEKFIINKTKNFAHLEASSLFNENDTEKVRKMIKMGVDIAGREDCKFHFIPRSENNRLPPRLDILPYQVL
jgi:beta-1,4-mannosyl-glycoprotein beta-1,4-N-acetylglucosaminyltransferase